MAIRKKSTRKTAAKKSIRKTAAKKNAAKKAATGRGASARTAARTVKAPARTAKKAARKAVKKTAPAKRPAAKKATARKTAAGKTTVRKATARKTIAGKATAQDTGRGRAKTAARKTVKKAASRRETGTQTPRKTAGRGPMTVTSPTPTMARRRRAARTDAETTMPSAAGTTTNFGTNRTASPRDTDREARGGQGRRSGDRRKVTPEEALATTRELLEAKQERDRQPPPWRQFDDTHGQPATEGSGEGRQEASEATLSELHEAETRLEGTQGSISTQDRHQQGRRDARD